MSALLPPPAILEHYEKVLPGAAERIVRLAELEAGHRCQIEARLVQTDLRRAERGQILAFVLAATMVSGGFILVVAGRRAEGLALMVLTAAGLVTSFVIARRRRPYRISASR